MSGALVVANEEFIKLTPHVSYYSWELYESLRESNGLDFFRQTSDKKGVVVIDTTPNKLESPDICIINDLCDESDPKKNRSVKQIIGLTINSYMGDQNFQTVEFGAVLICSRQIQENVTL